VIYPLTKKSIAWVSDSTAYIPQRLLDHPDFYTVPLNIHFGEKQYADGIDLTSEQLYTEIKNAVEFPKTSQPSAGLFADKYNEISNNYDEAIAIHLSTKMSGTQDSSIGGAELANFPVTFVDSLSLSYGATALIDKGMEMQENGATVPEIKEALDKMAGTVTNYILMGQLEQLYKGGRMSGAQYYLGSLLKIKPIVQISKEGKLEPIDKVRSEKRALQYLVDKVIDAQKNGVKKVYLMQGNVIEQAEKLKGLIVQQVPDLEVEIGELSSVLAVHAGEGTIAVLWCDET